MCLSVVFRISHQALNIGLVSDVHINPDYNENVPFDYYMFCDNQYANNTFPSVIKAPLGRIGCDPPPFLVDQMLRKLN